MSELFGVNMVLPPAYHGVTSIDRWFADARLRGMTPRQMAEMEQCLKDTELPSFKTALTQLRSLIKCHDLLLRYLTDIQNRRDHDPEFTSSCSSSSN